MKRPRRRARLTIAAAMLAVAIVAVFLALTRERLRPRREVHIAVAASGLATVNGQTIEPDALTGRILNARAERVVISSTPDVSYGRMSLVLGAIASAGIRDVQFTSRYSHAARQQRAAAKPR